MKIKNKSVSFFWILPFVAFISGYLLIRLFFSAPSTIVPLLVGIPIDQAVTIASEHQLSIQIIAETVDENSKPGTVISQKPQANQKAKHHQIIYLVTAKQPEPKKTPELAGKSFEQASQELSKAGISYKTIILHLQAPTTLVLAQQPEAAQSISEPILLYMADYHQPVILPDFRTKLLSEVQEFLEKYHIPSTVTTDRPQASSYRIEEQRPLAGTILSLTQPPTIQLLAKAA